MRFDRLRNPAEMPPEAHKAEVPKVEGNAVESAVETKAEGLPDLAEETNALLSGSERLKRALEGMKDVTLALALPAGAVTSYLTPGSLHDRVTLALGFFSVMAAAPLVDGAMIGSRKIREAITGKRHEGNINKSIQDV